MNKTNFSWLLVCLLLLLSGCVSKTYQEQESISNLRTRLDQAPPADKQKAAEFIEQKRKFIKSIPTNQNISAAQSVSIKGAKIWVKVKEDGVCTIYFSGQMTSESEQAFYRVAKFSLQKNCNDVLLKLSSDGGLVTAGIGVGLTANNFGWSTLSWRENINNYISCRSSCGIAYLGGKTRYYYAFSIGRDAGHIGLHQFSLNNVCIVDPSDFSYTLLDKYLNIAFPEDPTLMMGKFLNEPCNKTSYVISSGEKLYSYFPDKYTNSVFEKYE